MKITDAAKKLPPEAIELISKNQTARDLLREVLEYGRVTINLEPTYDSREKEAKQKKALMDKLSGFGLLNSEGKVRVTYAIPVTQKLDTEGRPMRDETIVAGLSDAILYSELDSSFCDGLEHNLGKVAINGMEGVLTIRNGSIYHITQFIDQTPLLTGGVRPTPMIREARIPVSALRGIGRNLNLVQGTSVGYSCHERAKAPGLCRLLRENGVEQVYGNLPGEDI